MFKKGYAEFRIDASTIMHICIQIYNIFVFAQSTFLNIYIFTASRILLNLTGADFEMTLTPFTTLYLRVMKVSADSILVSVHHRGATDTSIT